jgi:hypothetical protein
MSTRIAGRQVCRSRRGALPCALFRELIAQHCGTKQKAPGSRRGGFVQFANKVLIALP